MKSTDLPVTEWWDPEWDLYDVPLSPFDDGVDVETWWAAYEHLWMLSWVLHGTEAYIDVHYQHQLTTGIPEGCTCRDAPGWYPGRPAAALCPVHGSHRKICPAVPLLSRSRHQEGCGWRCPDCGATYTLTRIQEVDPAIRLYPTLKWIRNTPQEG